MDVDDGHEDAALDSFLERLRSLEEGQKEKQEELKLVDQELAALAVVQQSQKKQLHRLAVKISECQSALASVRHEMLVEGEQDTEQEVKKLQEERRAWDKKVEAQKRQAAEIRSMQERVLSQLSERHSANIVYFQQKEASQKLRHIKDAISNAEAKSIEMLVQEQGLDASIAQLQQKKQEMEDNVGMLMAEKDAFQNRIAQLTLSINRLEEAARRQSVQKSSETQAWRRKADIQAGFNTQLSARARDLEQQLSALKRSTETKMALIAAAEVLDSGGVGDKL